MTRLSIFNERTRQVDNAIGRVLQAAYTARHTVSVEQMRNDAAAECRWWNTLTLPEKRAYVGGAKGSPDCVHADWLDIGETNRHRILNAAHAVECWLASADD